MFLWMLSAAMLAQDPGSWNTFAKLQLARTGACAAPLGATGKILIAGGIDASGEASASVEILAPEGVSQFTAPLKSARVGHTCTALNDGRVLVTGGTFAASAPDAEVFDAASELWLPVTSAGPARRGATATLLQDGRVLIAGGMGADSVPMPYTEIFDPSSNRFTAARGQLNQPRRGHTANLLLDGRVVLAGGTGLNNAVLRSTELFDPLTSIVWSGPDLNALRSEHAAVTLEDGRVLVVGGETTNRNALASAETLDLAGSAWTLLRSSMSVGRRGHDAILIPGNGGVLIAGGVDTNKIAAGGAGAALLPSAAPSEFFDPATNAFRQLNELDAVDGIFATPADGLVVACAGARIAELETPVDDCSRIQFPAISFTAGVYHPQETVKVSGRNLPANSTLTFGVDFLRGSLSNPLVTASPQFRVLGPRIATDAAGAFAETQMLIVTTPDMGSRMRLTATLPNGGKLVRHVPLKYLSTLVYTLPGATVEGQNTALRVEVTPVNGAPAPSGSVTSTFGPVTLVELLNGAASASYSSSRLPTGALSVTSVYPGDAYYDAAISRTTMGVASRTPVIDVVASTIAPQIGVPFTVYAQIRVDALPGVSGGPAITGAVTIYESGVAIGRGRVMASQTSPYPQILTAVEYTTLRLGPELRFSATFDGDANYRPATSGTLVTLIQRALPSLSMVAVPSIFNLKPAPGVPVRFHCDVPVAFNVGMNFPPLLSIENRAFTINAVSKTGATSTLGGAEFAIDKAGVGTAQAIVTIPNDTQRVTAEYAGDGSMRPASSAWVLTELIPAPVSVTFVDLPKTVTTQFVTLKASVVTDAGKGCRIDDPTGEVEFFIGKESAGRFPLRNNGASITIQRPFEAGTQDFFIRYYGDALHTPTDSAIVTVTFE